QPITSAPRDWTAHPAAQIGGGILAGAYHFVGSNAQSVLGVLFNPYGWAQQIQRAMLQNAVTEYRKDGVVGGAVAAINTVNPLYALAVTGIDAKTAGDKGDYWNAAKGWTILGLTVASVFIGGRGGAARGAGEGAGV